MYLTMYMYGQYDNVVSKLGAMKEYFKGTNFHGNYFRNFFGHFAGSDIRESGFTKDFVEINFANATSTKI